MWVVVGFIVGCGSWLGPLWVVGCGSAWLWVSGGCGSTWLWVVARRGCGLWVVDWRGCGLWAVDRRGWLVVVDRRAEVGRGRGWVVAEVAPVMTFFEWVCSGGFQIVVVVCSGRVWVSNRLR